MEVVGIELVDYTSKSGNQVKGKKLHMCYATDKVNGMAVLQEYVPEKVECNVKVGDTVQLFYNKYGQVNQVYII